MRDGFVVWFTGLPASGKTTLAKALEAELRRRGVEPVQRLDGDIVRQDLTRDLGFSKEDRDENIRRVSFVASLLAKNGVAVLCAFVSPYREARRKARLRCPNFVEVYCRASLSALIERDPKGLYKKALAGEITNFTGIDDPYEEPEAPEVICDTDRETVEESLEKVLQYLEDRGLIPETAATRNALRVTDSASSSSSPSSRVTLHASPILPHGGTLVDLVVAGKEREALVREAAGLPVIELDPYYSREFYCLATGIYSPLSGFMGEREYRSVVESMRLPDGTVWSLPIVLPVEPRTAEPLRPGGAAALVDGAGKLLGVLEGIEIYERDPTWEAEHVFGTASPEHPGVARLMAEPRTLIGGRLRAVDLPDPGFPEVSRTPREVREEIARRGWGTVAAFQTRNPLHRAHEYLLRCALEVCDGLLLSPLVGETKLGDLPAEVRLRTYRALLDNYFPRDRVLIAAFPANMRYAGPREAIFHALCRKNFGATHFIVGRDHAGVGDFYGPYDAQEIFDRFSPGELGVVPLKFRPAFWCKRCGGMATEKSCPHPESERIALSGTKLREMLSRGEVPPPEITRPEVAQILIEAMGEGR